MGDIPVSCWVLGGVTVGIVAWLVEGGARQIA